jgi:pimeloyl-ACP methyl ester carboxylesterase
MKTPPDLENVTTLLLIHGGLWEEGMDARRFWGQPGIIAGLQRHGFDVLAPGRLREAPDWTAEASRLASALSGPVIALAGSNGCSAAARLALDFPGAVTRMILAAHPGRPAPNSRRT